MPLVDRVDVRAGWYLRDWKQPWWKYPSVDPIFSLVAFSDQLSSPDYPVGILRVWDTKLISLPLAARVRVHFIGWVFVPEDGRGKGIGSRLMSAIEWVSAVAVPALALYSSVPGGGIYAKAGFARVSDAHGGLWAKSLVSGLKIAEGPWCLDTEEHL